jgi:hypothetical protein
MSKALDYSSQTVDRIGTPRALRNLMFFVALSGLGIWVFDGSFREYFQGDAIFWMYSRITV